MVKRAKEHPELINEEYSNLKMLKQLIDDYIKGRDITIKVVILKDFSKELETILDKSKPKIFPKIGGDKTEKNDKTE